MWEMTHLSLGEQKVGKKTTAMFKYIPQPGTVSQMQKDPGGNWMIKTSCGCSEGTWNPDNYELTVTFTPQAVPKHLKEMGGKSYATSKNVTGNMIVNNSLEPFELKFTAVISE